MNRTQTACFALLASAFVLSAILIVRLDTKTQPNAAMADGQLISQNAFTLMTARTRGDSGANSEESLFLLDNTKGILLVYTPDVGNKRIEPLVPPMKMSDLFK